MSGIIGGIRECPQEPISDDALAALKLGVSKTVGLARIEKQTALSLLARLEKAEQALRPFAGIADIFDQVAGNRPREGEIMSWIDHRVGERVLTVEMLRAARDHLEGSGRNLADANSKSPTPSTTRIGE